MAYGEIGEIILASFILPRQEGLPPVLNYSPSSRCILLSTEPAFLGFLNIDSKSVVKYVCVGRELHYQSRVVLSSDSPMAALSAQFRQSKMMRLCIFRTDHDNTDITSRPPHIFLEPRFRLNITTAIKIFPDGSQILVVNSFNEKKKQIFGTLMKLPEDFWFESLTKNESEYNTCDHETEEDDKCTKNVEFARIHLSGIPRKIKRKERFGFRFESVAISPDVTQILAGSTCGYVLIIDIKSLRVLHYQTISDFYSRTYACQYSPTFGHHEFATVHQDCFLRIWKIEECDDGSEELESLHILKVESERLVDRPALSYSPDGQLIAYSSTKTHIICPRSGAIMFTLDYNEEMKACTHFAPVCLNLFFGHVCEIAVLHDSLGIWKLPVIYSLKTLCLLLLRSLLKYKDIEELPLPRPLILRLKYLYV